MKIEDQGPAMTGFVAGLSSEQMDAALAYRGPENFGPDEFRREPATSQPPLPGAWSEPYPPSDTLDGEE